LKVPILMYHEIIDENNDNRELFKIMQRTYFVGRDKFEEQLAYLKTGGYRTVTLREMVQYIEDPATFPLPEKSVILTFDDGYHGNYAHAFPLLKKYGFSAVFFVTIKLVGTPLMLSWSQMKEMTSGGMSIQSHTMTHPFLKQLSDDEITRELRDSKLAIEGQLGAAVEYIALPNGSYGPSYKKIAQMTGYAGGCSSQIGYATRSSDRYLLRRIHVSGAYRVEEFAKIMTGTGYFVAFLALKKNIKTLVRDIMGETLYSWLYRMIFGIKKM
jgi:peptidoglycan/xylan/chitin deacetylase (PgdA/CDA1 family)